MLTIFKRISLPKRPSKLYLTRSYSIRIAIVGTGPSALYAAKYILVENERLRKELKQEVQLDLFEKLPFPYGLVRYGVAPDHPEVKSVIESSFENVLSGVGSSTENRDGGDSKVRLFANIEIGRYKDATNNATSKEAIPLSALQKAYSAVILAYGADSDYGLGLKNESIGGVLSARSFVNWYNSHPEYVNLHKTAFDLRKVKHVVIIGQGNVALDCARILARDPNELNTTDISSSALEQLSSSSIETVTVVGRRGHAQAAFTIKELRELTKLPGVNLNISQTDLSEGMTASTELELLNNRPKKRIIELMHEIAINSHRRKDESADKSLTRGVKRTIDIRFLLSPKEIIANTNNQNNIGSMKFNRNYLEGEPFKQRAIEKADEEIILPCDLLLKSVGYKCSPIDPDLPFDMQSNTIPHLNGRVKVSSNKSSSATGKLYVTGWLKRGATGIIGSNINDARETVASLMEDIRTGLITPTSDPIESISNEIGSQKAELILSKRIDWEGIRRLNQIEIDMGRATMPPKEREKLTDANKMTDLAKT